MRWPPYEHIFFDCDSTLTTVEGIDILAETAGKKWRVEVLTNAAMDGHLNLEDVYAKRLQAIHPTRDQIRQIRRIYKKNVVEDAAAVIAALQMLGHQVYIISGGLAEPVMEFGISLGVPRSHIRAVGVTYNELSDRWWDPSQSAFRDNRKYMHYEHGALTVSDGKAQIVKELMGQQNGRSLLIGDGTSDLLASHAVNLFVGFGGVAARKRVQENAPLYLQSKSLSPLLAVATGPAGLRLLKNTPYQETFEKGLNLIKTGAITFNNERIKTKFNRAFNVPH
jgi:phosphoserine phosphatase